MPLLVQIGNQLSNNVVIPVANGSRTCTPTSPGLAGNVFQQLTTSTSAVGLGDLVLRRAPTSCGTPPCQPPYQDQAKAEFASATIPAADQPFIISYLDVEPIGTCLVSNKANPVTPYTLVNGLDAGTITLQGPNGSMTLTETPGTPTEYSANLGPGNYLVPGNYTFSATGKDLPPFNVPVTIPAMPSWTNQSSTTVDRSNPLTITWTAGASNTYVQIQGTSYTDSTGTTGATFKCLPDPSALSFNVPSNVLQQLPAGNYGDVIFAAGTLPANFTLSGLVYSYTQSYYQTASYLEYQ